MAAPCAKDDLLVIDELGPAGTLDLFSRLIKTGLAWASDEDGHIADDLIQFGWITPTGVITPEGAEYAAGPPDWA